LIQPQPITWGQYRQEKSWRLNLNEDAPNSGADVQAKELMP
jgi:hypothetical protein